MKHRTSRPYLDKTRLDDRQLLGKSVLFIEVKAWLADRMQRDEVLVILAKALTSESWSTELGGFGSLGDRVSRRQARAQIRNDFEFFDSER